MLRWRTLDLSGLIPNSWIDLKAPAFVELICGGSLATAAERFGHSPQAE
ncbi:hypothetical protein [Pseudomonas syringae group sp. J254-4]|nr:hypothetical protein [Pseudomonas syringae group sp. J254-4]MDU8456203.1 hypothetical protein [Pseudomonas syringae group sp. J254-4]